MRRVLSVQCQTGFVHRCDKSGDARRTKMRRFHIFTSDFPLERPRKQPLLKTESSPAKSGISKMQPAVLRTMGARTHSQQAREKSCYRLPELSYWSGRRPPVFSSAQQGRCTRYTAPASSNSFVRGPGPTLRPRPCQIISSRDTGTQRSVRGCSCHRD